jgi:hypothetical protein
MVRLLQLTALLPFTSALRRNDEVPAAKRVAIIGASDLP